METSRFTEGIPSNIEELKKMTHNKNSADTRIKAVEELGKWRCRQTIDVLWRLMINDLVYEVQNAAFLKLQAFGEDVKLPKKKKGCTIKGINKKIEKILKVMPENSSYMAFCEQFKNKEPEAFDVYKHEKKNKFDEWLKNVIKSMPQEYSNKIVSWDN